MKSTNRYLSKHERDYQIENTCIKHIRKLSETHASVNQLEIFEKMNEEITDLLKDHNERAILEYFDVSAWIYSKLKKVSFASAVSSLNQ